MAILPLRLTWVKSDSLFRRTVPRVVANMTFSSAAASGSLGSGRIEVIRSPFSSGSMLISALPRDCGEASGSRQTFSL